MFAEPSLFGAYGWSNTEFAEAVGLSAQRVGAMVKEGILPSPVNGMHDPKKAVLAYVQFLKKKDLRQGRDKQLTRKLELDNELKQVRLKRLTGELMARDAVTQAWFTAGRQIRDTLENLPDRLAGPLAAETDQTAVFNLLRGEIHHVLENLGKAPDVKGQKMLAAV